MMGDRFRLREGSSDDLPTLAKLDSSFSNEWVLHFERRGGQIEQTVELRWRHVKPAGSRRAFEMDVEELTRELQRSERLVVAQAGSGIAGYLMLGANWNGTAELADLIVGLVHRRRGLGRRFVQEAETYARERGLRALQWEAQTDNRDAIEFAVSQGFRIAGVNDALYDNRGYERQDAPDFRGLAVFLTRELD
jgi:ribosomal protein S18 acetylase RimI-like enzyme